ncbi:hypothetical protein [Streptomyces sp. GSL17-111]|uniref:hypothetical protein n=1 Tax=Streptomyces sp. GSL17-111 TaxID=3121596 RepID=UPI0030F40B43
MLRHVIAPTRFYSQIPNELIRHPRLSSTAVRMLEWALSLPEGSRETFTSLSEKLPEGRITVRKARQQLAAEGYVHTRQTQDRESGRWQTVVLISNVPLTTAAAVDAAFAGAPGGRVLPVGEPGERAVGDSPKGEEQPENTPHPPRPAAPDAEPHAEPRSEPEPEPGPEPVPDEPEPGGGDGAGSGRAARVLAELGRAEPRLRLGVAEAARLAPLARQWLARGVGEAELREALTAGLPRRVHAPAAFVAHRLTAKLPPPVAPRTPPPPPLAECAECRDPLPRGQRTGICRPCAGLVPPPEPAPGLPPAAARARAAFEAARARTRCV